jgi:hypothetical protein
MGHSGLRSYMLALDFLFFVDYTDTFAKLNQRCYYTISLESVEPVFLNKMFRLLFSHHQVHIHYFVHVSWCTFLSVGKCKKINY